MQNLAYNRERLARGLLATEWLAFMSTADADQTMPDFWGVTTLSFQVATPYFFDAVVPYGPRTECGHVYMTHGDHFRAFLHTLIWAAADSRHRTPPRPTGVWRYSSLAACRCPLRDLLAICVYRCNH